MKKTLIAGAASVALAAMPVLGVFAADTLTPITDTVTVTIDSACSLSGTGATPSATMNIFLSGITKSESSLSFLVFPLSVLLLFNCS